MHEHKGKMLTHQGFRTDAENPVWETVDKKVSEEIGRWCKQSDVRRLEPWEFAEALYLAKERFNRKWAFHYGLEPDMWQWREEEVSFGDSSEDADNSSDMPPFGDELPFC